MAVLKRFNKGHSLTKHTARAKPAARTTQSKPGEHTLQEILSQPRIWSETETQLREARLLEKFSDLFSPRSPLDQALLHPRDRRAGLRTALCPGGNTAAPGRGTSRADVALRRNHRGAARGGIAAETPDYPNTGSHLQPAKPSGRAVHAFLQAHLGR